MTTGYIESSGSSLRAPTRNPLYIGEVLGIPGQACDDGRWTIFLNLLTLDNKLPAERPAAIKRGGGL